MHADIQGALNRILKEPIKKTHQTFQHNGRKMSLTQVIKVLEYSLSKGYKTTAELSDEEVDHIISLHK